MFIPELNKICDVQLHARQVEPVLLGDGTKRVLLRVDQTSVVDGKPRPEYDARIWVDAEGQVLKSEQDVLGGIVMYRTNKEAATAPIPEALDVLSASILKTDRRISNWRDTRTALYRLRLDGENPSDLFPTDIRQSVRRLTDGTVVLQICTPAPPASVAAAPSPGEEYLMPNTMIDSKNPKVVAHARKAISDAGTDPWNRAKAITRWMAKNVRGKLSGNLFASATDVAETLSGDSSEFSVLAAAMCRAVDIPARVVVGFHYVDEAQGFGLHMWNEVFINGQWRAIDPTLGQTEIDATHLKVNTSSLAGDNLGEIFNGVFRLLGKLRLEPMELTPEPGATQRVELRLEPEQQWQPVEYGGNRLVIVVEEDGTIATKFPGQFAGTVSDKDLQRGRLPSPTWDTPGTLWFMAEGGTRGVRYRGTVLHEGKIYRFDHRNRPVPTEEGTYSVWISFDQPTSIYPRSDRTADPVAQVPAQEKVQLLFASASGREGWHRVRTAQGLEGWVSGENWQQTEFMQRKR